MYTEEGTLSDLHRHLDGSLRPSTALDLAHARGLPIPPDLPFRPGMGLAAALDRFRFTLSLLDDASALRRVAAEICEDAAAEGVDTLEIRFAPQLHRGCTPREAVEAVNQGIAGRAGLILCALYGEAPEAVEGLVELALACPGVCGLDLAGGPAPDHRWGMLDYADAFQEARRKGLGTTVHAGEGRPPEEIRQAVELLGVRRIGHGTTLLEDPSLPGLLIERGVTIEACITSNWHVGAIPEPEAHPIARWVQAGVAVCVCTDNTLLSQTDSQAEHALARRLLGEEGFARVRDAGRGARFGRG